MSMVGPDKRLNYYRLAPDEVIAALHSHKLGLTNAEARRRAEVQQNILPPPQEQPVAYRYLRQAQPLTLLGILAAIGLAASLGDATLLCVLAAVLCTHLTLTWITWDNRRVTEPSFTPLLPDRSRVVRNDQTETIAIASVVVGDIVHLQAGDRVPADIRLIDAQNVTADDAAVVDGGTHVHKFVHALESDVPLSSRNNLLFAGTTITTGEAHGIVIATGKQTELGRIQHLARAQSKPPTGLEQRLQYQRAALALGGFIALLIVTLITTKEEPTNAARMLLLALVAFIGGTLPFLQQLADVATKWHIGRSGVKVRGLRDIENVGQADILLGDPAAFSDNTAAVASFIIGRTSYSVNGNGYEPHGRILDAQGKPVAKTALRELSLFFEAATLAHHATVFAPDAEHSTWHPHGNPAEAALLTVARRAGLQTEQLRDQHEVLGFFQHDAHRQLQSAIRSYGKDRVLFVLGSPEALLTRSVKLWDHGHVRPLSDRDTTQLITHQTRQTATGLTCIALACRILPKNVHAQSLSMERAEQRLTFLGLMDIEHDTNIHARALLQAAQGGHTRISLLTRHTSQYTIDSERLRRISDEHLLERLRKGSATFAQLTAEDKLRLVSVAQRARHTVAMCGASLSDLPALTLANVTFGSNNTCNNSWLGRVTDVCTHDVAQVAGIGSSARTITSHLSRVFSTMAISQFAALTLGLLSLGASIFLHTPLGITPLQLLMFLVILQPLAAVFVCAYVKSRRVEEAASLRAISTFGIFAGSLAFANFFVFFVRSNISAAYLDPTSTLVAHATTITLASLVLALWIDALLGFRERGTLSHSHQRIQVSAVVAGAVSLVLMLGIIYAGPLHTLLHTQGLNLADWIYVALGGVLYACLHLFEYGTRHHARPAVIQLHRQKFGKNSPSRI